MIKLGEGLLARVAKRIAVNRLVAQGYREDAAESLVDRAVTSEEIAQHAVETGALGDGKILGVLRKIADWLGDPANQAKLEGIVEFILKMVAILAPLFAKK